MVENQILDYTNQEWERTHKHGELIGSDPTLCTPLMGDPHWENESSSHLAMKTSEV